MVNMIQKLKIDYTDIFLIIITTIVFYIMIFTGDIPRSRKIIFSIVYCTVLYFFLVLSNIVSPENNLQNTREEDR